MQRGEVWWAQFEEQHPVVLLSGEPAAGFEAVQIVAPSGADVGRLGIEVRVGSSEGLPFDGVVRVAYPRPGFVPCTWVTTVGPDDLVERLGILSVTKLGEIEQAIESGRRPLDHDDPENQTAVAALAEIREALRRGAITAPPIRRPGRGGADPPPGHASS